ncbi:hypothetical protein MMB17_07310 [Methylobacterium organophilum]|uniref:hypothetical protein n=1 Tax=Methylobacterium organophilum TaxID=410 RepID=UPI001F12CCD4|nr:hypothetical protein [Methylobacterium organophilum]UMY19098.1 hypothetical protein MMB17_07310 [Methylobacterium organophilum]
MTEHLELTGAGFVIRNAAGGVIKSVTIVDGVGDGALLVTDGAVTVEVPFDLAAFGHFAQIAGEKHRNARLAHRLAHAEPLVPRRVPVPAAEPKG